jgi:hypothetical protein
MKKTLAPQGFFDTLVHMINKIINRFKQNSINYAYSRGMRLWVYAPAADCTPAEIAGGRIDTDKDAYNKWNPELLKAGYPSPYKQDRSFMDKVLIFITPKK